MAEPASETFDIAVVGAGPAGLAAAVLLAEGGARIAVFGPRDANEGDARTSALFVGAVRMLERAGAWPALRASAAPLARLRIVDRVSRPDHPSVVVFEAGEIGEQAFGHNIPNDALVRVLEERLTARVNVARFTQTVTGVDHHDGAVALTTADGMRADARLLIAADGRRSPARRAAGIDADEWAYGQLALAARITHEGEHAGTSSEIHRPGGPLTTVPLPGRSSAIVLLDRTEAMNRIAALDQRDFEDVLARELDGLLGTVRLAGPRATFPVTGLSVSTFAARRTVLIGEAAHVVPPIGAQGLNLGLRDGAWIAEIALAALATGDDPGSDAVLACYRRARRADVISRRTASDLLNRSLLLDSSVVHGFRGLGLLAVSALGPLRRAVMRAGLASERDLPAAMRAL